MILKITKKFRQQFVLRIESNFRAQDIFFPSFCHHFVAVQSACFVVWFNENITSHICIMSGIPQDVSTPLDYHTFKLCSWMLVQFSALCYLLMMYIVRSHPWQCWLLLLIMMVDDFSIYGCESLWYLALLIYLLIADTWFFLCWSRAQPVWIN